MLNVSDLNLATQPFVNRRRFYVLASASAIVLSLSLIVLAGAFVHSFRSEQGMRRDLRKVRDEVAALEMRQKRLQDALAEPKAADTLDAAQFLNELIRQKAVSWTRIFMDLERVMPDRVQAVTLRPVIKLPGGKGATGVPVLTKGPLVMDLQMTVSAEKIEGLFELLHRLENSSGVFQNPILYTEGRPSTEGAGGIVQVISNVPRPMNASGNNDDRMLTLQYSVTYAQ